MKSIKGDLDCADLCKRRLPHRRQVIEHTYSALELLPSYSYT